MTKQVSTIFLLFVLLTGLAACDAAPESTSTLSEPSPVPTAVSVDTAVPTATLIPEPPPTETPPPTDTPTPLPTDTPTPDPLAGYTAFQNKALGISLSHPADWVIETDELNSSLLLANSQAALASDVLNGIITAIFVSDISDETKGMSAADFADGIGQSLKTDDSFMNNAEQLTEIREFSIEGQSAANVEFKGVMNGDGSSAVLLVTVITTDDRVAVIMGFISLPYEDEARPVLADIVNTIVVTEPVIEAYDTSMYVVAEYDAARDPAEDTAVALERAQAEGKYVLLIVGGDWCPDCRVLERLIGEDPILNAGFKQNFVAVKVNISEENQNEAFLAQYPDFEWVPHFYILENDGTLAQSFDTRNLMTDDVFDEAKIITFLGQWLPPELTEFDDLYLVDHYDPERDPAADVATAVTIAQQQNKNILLIAGGNWCIWCFKLSDFIHNTPEVEAALSQNFIIIKVNVSEENYNEAFFSQYPDIPGYPYLLVLDSSGNFIHDQSTGEFEIGGLDDGYDVDKVLEFVSEWSP